ncbi:hypothetical protein LWI29_037748 [Acer saccharum]|uniref:Uncharacterized protein n=1 Tax=Acer saccharum TaxID=4024 RepID=A0AA39VFA1_ACESA|nr:hypothetical protein LWI29_037748 [Acer saccharum]
MAASSSSSSSILLLLLFMLSLFSTAFTSVHGFIDDPLIQQVVSSDGRDDLLTSAENQFSEFKKKYGKTYPTEEEEDYRFGVFISNLRLARRNQIMDPTAVHGVTKFSDLTLSEFRRQYLGSGRQIQLPDYIGKRAPTLPTNNLPEKLNWTEKGAVTAVKNQSNCDGCWAFSTIAVLEGAYYLTTNKKELVELSVQQLIDCSTATCTNYSDGSDPICNKGCGGGQRLLAFEYIKEKAGGVVKADDYNFTGETDNCKLSNNDKNFVASVSEYGIIPLDEDQYAAYLEKHGPLAVSTAIDIYQSYISGVMCPHKEYSSNEITAHAVTLVGYDNSTDAREFQWIVKNSYGEDWGEFGYFRLCKNYLAKRNPWDPRAMYAVAVAKNKTDI